MGCSRESIRTGFHVLIRQPDGNSVCARKTIEWFCLLEFQHISVMTDNLDLVEQWLENLIIAGTVGEVPRSFLLSFLK